jgi:REP element-mobilizing transposase RayT
MHVFVRYRPDQKISDIARKLKASLSYWLRREGELPDFESQDGYGAFSVSHSDTDRIINYIRKQNEHHQDGSTNEHLEPTNTGPSDPESAGV